MSTISCSSLNDVIAFAIEKEDKSMEFYLQCAQRAKNPGIRAFFEELAAEERHHREMLQALEPEDLSSVRLDPPEDLRISDHLIDSAFRPDITYQDALILAMKREEKAQAFYSTWKHKCVSEKAAGLFAILAAEEAKHKHRLEIVYDEEILTWD